MSIEAVNWALLQPLKGNQKFVLVILAHHANKDGECWPGLKLIAEEGGMSRASVISHINQIANLGFLHKAKRHDNKGYRRSTLYKLNFSQSLESQRREILRRDYGNQSQKECVSKVQDLDANIIERSLEQSREQPNVVYETEKIDFNVMVKDVFQYWQEVMNHPQAKLDPKRIASIKQAIKNNFSVEDLKNAINGCSKSPFNMGQNDRNQIYDDIGLIMRDASHIERFISYSSHPPIADQPKQNKNIVMEGVI